MKHTMHPEQPVQKPKLKEVELRLTPTELRDLFVLVQRGADFSKLYEERRRKAQPMSQEAFGIINEYIV